MKKGKDYLGDNSDERLYIDLRQSNEYTDELEKPKRNDSKMTITIETKQSLTKKTRLKVWDYANGGYIYLLNDNSLT